MLIILIVTSNFHCFSYFQSSCHECRHSIHIDLTVNWLSTFLCNLSILQMQIFVKYLKQRTQVIPRQTHAGRKFDRTCLLLISLEIGRNFVELQLTTTPNEYNRRSWVQSWLSWLPVESASVFTLCLLRQCPRSSPSNRDRCAAGIRWRCNLPHTTPLNQRIYQPSTQWRL